MAVKSSWNAESFLAKIIVEVGVFYGIIQVVGSPLAWKEELNRAAAQYKNGTIGCRCSSHPRKGGSVIVKDQAPSSTTW